jgi:hypothetical protein
MSRRSRAHLVSRGLLTAVALLLVAGLLSASPAAAHPFTKTDPNDTPGLLDLRSASVAHRSTAVVHSFRTFAGWAPGDLGRNSSGFIIGIDKNNDPRQAERCVFVISLQRRLRAFMTDCLRTLNPLSVSKPNRTTVNVTIPKTQTGLSYRWAVVSLYFEERPCLNGCVDGVPNLTSFILHDLIPPTVAMDTDPLRVWEAGTDADFNLPFSVSDTGGAGVATWRVQRREPGGEWVNTGVSGTGGGAKNPIVTGEEGTRNRYRVVVVDKHANHRNGPSRIVYIPTDDDDLDPADFSPAPTPQLDADAFGGSYSQMAATDVFTYTFAPPPGDCTFELVGPGEGDWSVSVVAGVGAPEVITAPGSGDRLTLYTDESCAATYTVTVASGTGFAIDAVLGNSAP